MCQLLGMNCKLPTDICLSLREFHSRGGHTGDHADGWGIGFFERCGWRVFLDSKSSVASPLADFLRRHPINSTHTVAHIRKATHGKVALENTHPFQRELWGRYWIFAHNGNLQDFTPDLSDFFKPLGTTDSEAAFCYLLDQLHQASAYRALSEERLFLALQKVTASISAYGSFNYLLSDGNALFAHCSTDLYYLSREPALLPPHSSDKDTNATSCMRTDRHDKLTVVATQPVTDSADWIRLQPHTLLMIRDGSIVRTCGTNTVYEPSLVSHSRPYAISLAAG